MGKRKDSPTLLSNVCMMLGHASDRNVQYQCMKMYRSMKRRGHSAVKHIWYVQQVTSSLPKLFQFSVNLKKCEDYLDENLKSHHRQCAQFNPQGWSSANPSRSFQTSWANQTAMPRLHPRMFGHPNSRPRSWRICFHKDKKHWASKYSLEELAGILLVGKDTPVPLNYECYLFELRNANGALTEDQLTKPLVMDFSKTILLFKLLLIQLTFPYEHTEPYLRSHAHHLEKFRRACPEKGLYDLSANVDKRKRVELKDRTEISSKILFPTITKFFPHYKLVAGHCHASQLAPTSGYLPHLINQDETLVTLPCFITTYECIEKSNFLQQCCMNQLEHRLVNRLAHARGLNQRVGLWLVGSICMLLDTRVGGQVPQQLGWIPNCIDIIMRMYIYIHIDDLIY